MLKTLQLALRSLVVRCGSPATSVAIESSECSQFNVATRSKEKVVSGPAELLLLAKFTVFSLESADKNILSHAGEREPAVLQGKKVGLSDLLLKLEKTSFDNPRATKPAFSQSSCEL